ncbi:MAG: transporter substrate-binding protein [Acidimicrobiales bacterium]|nr:transporter substrate-binding protein [Acidimicrobiales bacterium]MXX42789.1 transporter substrate-binding protein [Acidimicrobiales bacterium]MYB82824.1 transporter substrate-binding protein [Acidimicrobiales bacterium]MYD33083.1 transporter substrate-binding protein [Acidimicrobiales bacterium]MYI10376.1 transporter substrate-binding protein [Acidimicrobiales bacterium]
MSANPSVTGRSARSRLSRLAVAIVALALTAAACTSSDDDAEPAADTAAAADAGTADTAAEAPETTAADEADDTVADEPAAPADTEPIRVGSLLDETGPLNIYGTPMADATRLAIADINAKGGVLGRQLELVALDSKSDQNEYIAGADRLVAEDLAVVHAGITSASREAIRPIFDEAELLYFYNVLYEGGVCDRNTFVTGVVPTQQLQVLIPWAIENMGPRLYVLAADYNYGQISADWVREYAAANGGEIVGEDFFPLDVAEFGTTISEVQDANPDAVVSLLVGGAHMSFYSQYNAAGVNADIPIVSTTFGLGSEQVALDAASSEGIIVAYPYFEELDTAANGEFVAAWHGEFGSDYPYITDLAVYVWEGWHLWADAVNAAGTLDRDAVIAQLESGVSFSSPKGEVSLDGGSHHLVQPVSLARANASNGFDVFETFDNIPPSFEQDVCDLIASPDTNQQFTP